MPSTDTFYCSNIWSLHLPIYSLSSHLSFYLTQYIILTFSSGVSFSYLKIFIFHLTFIVLSVAHLLRVGPWILHLTALSNLGYVFHLTLTLVMIHRNSATSSLWHITIISRFGITRTQASGHGASPWTLTAMGKQGRACHMYVTLLALFSLRQLCSFMLCAFGPAAIVVRLPPAAYQSQCEHPAPGSWFLVPSPVKGTRESCSKGGL